MTSFLPEPIKDIILHYLNPHELYIEELKNKTLSIYKSTNKYKSSKFYGYTDTFIVVRGNSFWRVGTSLFNYPKNNRIKELNKRVNKRNKILGIVESDRYGMKDGLVLATNFCYINY